MEDGKEENKVHKEEKQPDKRPDRTRSSFRPVLIPAVLLTLAVVCAALLLPGQLVKGSMEGDRGVVIPVPTAYYAGPSDSVVRNASRQLTEDQRLQLIYGEWDSTISPAGEEDCALTEYEVVRAFDYPGITDDKSWYSWKGEAYKAVDTTFETYVAVFWRVEFTKFDGTKRLVYYITEQGTLLEENRIER